MKLTTLMAAVSVAVYSGAAFASAAAVMMQQQSDDLYYSATQVAPPVFDFDNFYEVSNWFTKDLDNGLTEMRVCSGGIYRKEHNGCVKPTLRKTAPEFYKDLSIDDHIERQIGDQYNIVGKSLVSKYSRGSGYYYSVLVYLKNK